ncbi:MAG: hypothetical protein JST92_02035 [Deltaproteobacteria bacterium]|nr:hypothetical protein [Deltaproteobacteria bacterium]
MTNTDFQELDPADLELIRHAAFELRLTDVQEAIKALRKVVASGGPAAALARGALAEIYFEELADLDGAEGEYRALLKEAPGLPAAELGLSRVLRETGRLGEAEQSLARAAEGLSKSVRADKAAYDQGEELSAGVEEEVLALLEVAVELAFVQAERAKKSAGASVPGKPPVELALFEFAEAAQLFDADAADAEELEELGAIDEPDLSDWTRFYEHRARLESLLAGAKAAVTLLTAAEKAGRLPAASAARLLSHHLEGADELTEALVQGQRRLSLERAGGRLPLEDDLLHAAGLAQELGDEALAKAILAEGAKELEAQLAHGPGTPSTQPGAEHVLVFGGPEPEELEERLKRLKELLGPERLVGLGRKKSR